MKKTNYLISLYTLLHREMTRVLRLWVQSILPSAITSTLYFIIFGTILGNHLGEMHGIPYIQYLAPGLIMMNIINNAYANTSSSFFGAKFGKHIEEVLVAPMPNMLILLGYIGGGILRALLTGTVVTIVASIFTDLSIQHLGITLSVVFLSATLFSLVGLINAIYAKRFDDIAFIPNFILAPMIYLGGVFYSIDQLPGIWHNISLFNPIVYLINSFRYGLLGVSDINVVTSLFILSAIIIVMFMLAWYLLANSRGMRQ